MQRCLRNSRGLVRLMMIDSVVGSEVARARLNKVEEVQTLALPSQLEVLSEPELKVERPVTVADTAELEQSTTSTSRSDVTTRLVFL